MHIFSNITKIKINTTKFEGKFKLKTAHDRQFYAHLYDIKKSFVCFGVSVNPKMSIFISFSDDKLGIPVGCVY